MYLLFACDDMHVDVVNIVYVLFGYTYITQYSSTVYMEDCSHPLLHKYLVHYDMPCDPNRVSSAFYTIPIFLF